MMGQIPAWLVETIAIFLLLGIGAELHVIHNTLREIANRLQDR